MRRIIFISFFTLISIVSYGQWQSEGNNIYFNSGNVGIGTDNPTVKLNIYDNTDIERTFLKLENKSLSNTSSVNLRLFAGNNGSFTSLSHLSETYTGTPNQADFGQLWTNGAGLLLRANGGILRFETSEEDASIERMRIDVNGNIGIGTNNPTVKLDISDSTESDRTFLKLKNKSLSNTSSVNLRLFAGNNGSFTSLSHLSETYTGSPNQADFGQLWTTGAGLLLRANGGILRFETSEEGATNERMRIDVSGNVGINTTQPRERLEVNGNILIKDNFALILTSPNGTEFNITVDNNGNLVTSRVASTKPKTADINISIYPNPTKNYLTIHVNENTIQKIDVEIYDLSGKMVFMKNYTSNSFQINTIDLMTGTYILKLKDQYGNLIKTEKIIKQ